MPRLRTSKENAQSLYGANLSCNIIFLEQMSKKGNTLVLKGDYMWVCNEHEKLFMEVKRSPKRLYKLLIKEHMVRGFLTIAQFIYVCEVKVLGFYNFLNI